MNGMEREEWQMSFAQRVVSYQARRALLARVVPMYRTASRTKKHLILNDIVQMTGYARQSAIRLLNHPPSGSQTIRRFRSPIYGPEVQQALFLAWKATHAVCAKRLVPFLPPLIPLLERCGHLRLTEEHRRQVLAMSVSTAERLLRSQEKPVLHGFSLTTPDPLRKEQLSIRTFSPWQEDQPGFVEMDLVAHCGTHVDGSFLYTLTLTDLATCWTECIPLLYKSADAVVAALEQARVLFPFPLRGIDTDCGSEFVNEEVIAYGEQHQLTFTRGRPGCKNDQAHVEQKNGAVVRKVVGYLRLEGVQAYHQLREVYRALRLVVNCFQPSLKLQTTVSERDRVRRVYDVARTPLQRLLESGAISETQQEDLRARVQQIDPLALSEHLDALRYVLWSGAHVPETMATERPCLRFCLAACVSGTLSVSNAEPKEAEEHQQVPMSNEAILNWPRTTRDPFAGFWEEILAFVQEHPEWTNTQMVQGIEQQIASRMASIPMKTLLHRLTHLRRSLRTTWEEPWPTELIQGEPPGLLPHLSPMPGVEASASDQPAPSERTHPASPPDGNPRAFSGIMTHEEFDQTSSHSSDRRGPVPPDLAQAIETYVQDQQTSGRGWKTLQWHRTSLSALQQYLWEQFQYTEVRQLSREVLQCWVANVSTMRSSQTGTAFSVNTIAAYARSGRAFCHWLVRRGALTETPFPQGAVPKAQRSLPQPIEPTVFIRLLRACQMPDEPARQDQGMTLRNRAILWLLLDTGLSVSEVCGVCLGDVDRARGTVTVRGKRGDRRTLPLSEKGQRAVSAYLEHARLTPAWRPPRQRHRRFFCSPSCGLRSRKIV
jgi:site-specific recombinase XerC